MSIASFVYLTRWQRNGFLFVAGALGAFSMPPWFVLPVLIPSLGALFLFTYYAVSPRRAWWDGWFWGWGYFIVSLYWISNALLVDAEQFAWLVPFTVLGLNGVFALFPALACVVFRRFKQSGLAAIPWFTLTWLLSEIARGYVLTGFPWNMVGYALALSDGLIQPASFFGAYGLSAWVVLMVITPAALLLKEVPRTHALYAVGMAICVLLVGYGWGAWRIQSHQPQTTQSSAEEMRMRIVQANIKQQYKWDAEMQADNLRKHIMLSTGPGFEDRTHIIWPESALPFMVTKDSVLPPAIQQAVPKGGVLITGSTRGEYNAVNKLSVWNSVIAINKAGTIISYYDKRHLVPFGEYVPLREFLPINRIAPGHGDFSVGQTPPLLTLPNGPHALPLICYEAVFPELADTSALTGKMPGWLLNVTNDAWFGDSAGPYQHLHIARIRAVEQGLPLIRAANTGVSAFITHKGEISRIFPLNKEGVLDITINNQLGLKTIYGLYQHDSLLLLIALLIIFTIIVRRIKVLACSL